MFLDFDHPTVKARDVAALLRILCPEPTFLYFSPGGCYSRWMRTADLGEGWTLTGYYDDWTSPSQDYIILTNRRGQETYFFPR